MARSAGRVSSLVPSGSCRATGAAGVATATVVFVRCLRWRNKRRLQRIGSLARAALHIVCSESSGPFISGQINHRRASRRRRRWCVLVAAFLLSCGGPLHCCKTCIGELVTSNLLPVSLECPRGKQSLARLGYLFSPARSQRKCPTLIRGL